ncbi:MAG TPA: mobilization protein [Thermoanaerobaculia bacterium]|nr:mobilization protein [Thermoanaerobaculia bacterium]
MTTPDDPPADAAPPPPPTRRRRQGGRPHLPDGERRQAALPRVRVTAGELAAVRAHAEQLGLPVAKLIRALVLGRKLQGVPAINREAWGRLGPLAANLNQYVKAIHQGQAAGAPVDLLERLRTEVAALRELLLGRNP